MFERETQVGRYQIVCELGEGGMGTIYLARLHGIGGFERLMAIKMIHRNLSREPAFINMFLDEARIAASIRHPNVVPVYEVGEHRGRHFIAMDYVSGEPLSILLDNTWCLGIPLDFDIVVYILSGACDALHAAHELTDRMGRPLDLVHRDVCPQNIMIGYDGVPRVMDFGVAKAMYRLSHTSPGTQKGKVPYMAPEHIRGLPIDRRSDVFSLGVVLWEATIGRRLFKGENDTLSAKMVLKGRVPRPTRSRDRYPLELEAIVLKALNPNPDKRFQTARDMGQAMREYLARTSSVLSSADVESLLKSLCKRRYEKRREMERLACNAAEPIEDETVRSFAIEDSGLKFEINVLEPVDDDPLSLVTDREVYEFEDEEPDDATVRVELEELGFIGVTDFELLDDDIEAPATVIDDANDDELRALLKDTAPIVELPLDAILGPGDAPETREAPSRKRSIAIAAALAAVLVALGVASTREPEAPALHAKPKLIVAQPKPSKIERPAKVAAVGVIEPSEPPIPEAPVISKPKLERSKKKSKPLRVEKAPEPKEQRLLTRPGDL